MQLKLLLESIGERVNSLDCDDYDIKGLTLNSSAIKPAFAFLAIKGHAQDGRAFIKDAIQNKASVILAEAQGLKQFLSDIQTSIPIIPIDRLLDKVGLLAHSFYQAEDQASTTVGVTGTNGKTTCCFLITQTLQKLNCKSALMGTLGYGMAGKILQTQNLTTPDAVTLHQNYAALLEEGAKVIAMEVSSHGLDQNRLNGLKIDSGIFTNLTQDHLDYHKDMNTYLKAKQKLFERPELKRAIINLDSPYFDKVLAKINPKLPIFIYSLNQPKLLRRSYPVSTSFIYAKHYSFHNNGIVAEVVTPWGDGELRSPLMGDFNLSNLLAVLTEVCAQGYPLKEVLNALSGAQGAPGRMQRLGRGDLPEVIVDYAHTPDALEKALTAARQHCKRRLWCVFGCGGGRDKEKRHLMGEIASKLADKIIVTNDNPRMEPPRQIITDIMAGIPVDEHKKILIEEDRKAAISYAISHALSVDTIVIAGKGHESYQDLGKERLPFNDVECVEEIFAQGG
ncbi:MAG: UDP-N-acetylmuramoyl-L-alanyl-D-glutamate--2,6-diaminopimelate ligase [Candidatus Berkiella sp.]